MKSIFNNSKFDSLNSLDERLRTRIKSFELINCRDVSSADIAKRVKKDRQSTELKMRLQIFSWAENWDHSLMVLFHSDLKALRAHRSSQSPKIKRKKKWWGWNVDKRWRIKIDSLHRIAKTYSPKPSTGSTLSTVNSGQYSLKSSRELVSVGSASIWGE